MTTKDTQAKDPEREALIQEMLRDAESQKTELPSELTREPVIHRGDEDLPAPMVVNKITSAGYVYVWDTRSYEKIPILYYMLPSKMRQRREDGSYRFTTLDPGKKPKRGTYKCLLHKDAPDRARYDELGFRVCPKDNLTNQYQVGRHMKLKHPAEWNAIEDERKERERKEDRELQRMLIGKVAEKPTETIGTPEAPLYVSDKPSKKGKVKVIK